VGVAASLGTDEVSASVGVRVVGALPGSTSSPEHAVTISTMTRNVVAVGKTGRRRMEGIFARSDRRTNIPLGGVESAHVGLVLPEKTRPGRRQFRACRGACT
jgi:hypothetical protein